MSAINFFTVLVLFLMFFTAWGASHLVSNLFGLPFNLVRNFAYFLVVTFALIWFFKPTSGRK